MLLSPTGYSYNLTVYNSNEDVLSCDYSTSTTKSFMATKGTKTSAHLASYYIKVTSSSGYSTSNYRVIVFYALNYRNLEFAYPTTSTLTRLSSPVGYRTYNSEYHTGVDIPGSTSDTIYSVCNAVVLRAYDQTYLSDGSLGMGKFVQATTAFSTGSGYSNILDPYTNTVYTMRYMHMSELYVNTAYSNGTQIITKGTAIGKMGTTGASSGVHLHFDMNNGNHTLSADIKNDLQSLINPVDLYDVSFTGSAY